MTYIYVCVLEEGGLLDIVSHESEFSSFIMQINIVYDLEI